MKHQLLIPAAGMGLRLGSAGLKALVDLAGKPILVRTLERFRALGLCDGAVIVVPPAHAAAFETALGEAFPEASFTFARGGAERQSSVRNGLEAVAFDTDIVVIHDAARPFVGADAVRASIDAAAECGAATVAIPAVDTILQADDEGYLRGTPDRRVLWACQTPQTFRVEVIREAHNAARSEGFAGTDDTSLVRRVGGRVLNVGQPPSKQRGVHHRGARR